MSVLRNSLSGASLSVLGALLLAAPAFAQADGPVQLGPVSVSDQADKNGLSHSPPLASMPSTSLQDMPQAVNVIDQQTMKQQATTTLSDALRNVPGITIAIGEGGTLAGDQFKIRGFDAKDDVYLDGLRDFGAYTRDSFNYEEVQVLKGPSGLMFGRGTTGGAKAIHGVGRRQRHHRGAIARRLLGQQRGIVAGGKRGHAQASRVRVHHRQRAAADRSRRAEDGERSHGRSRR